MDLPVTDPHCESVDMIEGMWYNCSLCKTRVKVRSGRAWTMSRWNDHISQNGHHDLLKKNVDCVSGIRDKEKAGEVSWVYSDSFQHKLCDFLPFNNKNRN